MQVVNNYYGCSEECKDCKHFWSGAMQSGGACLKNKYTFEKNKAMMIAQSVECKEDTTRVFYEGDFLVVTLDNKVIARFDCCSVFDFIVTNFPEPGDLNTGQNYGITRRKLQCVQAQASGGIISNFITKMQEKNYHKG